MTNILQAILQINSTDNKRLVDFYTNRGNRITNIGDALERYIQDIFAKTINETNESVRNRKVSNTFSYLGNTSNPPDIILKNSDAIEVKKIESYTSGIALNSSFPKDKLFSNDSKITQACVDCEEWFEKDIIYATGVVQSSTLKHLWLIYGDCFAASKTTYERIANTISEGLTNIPDVEFSQTKELGRVNKVDPLGITYLRIRGMWGIDNPGKIFDYIYQVDKSKEFSLCCIMKKEKYDEFDKQDRESIENSQSFIVRDEKVKNPNNPAQLIDVKIITMEV